MTETVLIVDDEEGVRRTFQEWLVGSAWPIQVFAVADAEGALLVANEHVIDLAILDWNLGSGSDGLRLLEDLVEFHAEVVAILVTGHASQATPLEALRKGVRDYLDKNHDLNRETFLAAVKRQLDKIAPAKRQRELNQSIAAFRESLEQVLPLVRGAATLTDPVPLTDAVRSLFRFVQKGTGAPDGVLLIRQTTTDGSETSTAYTTDGELLTVPAVPFGRTLAAGVVSVREPCIMNAIDAAAMSGIELLSFEKNRRTILAVPLRVGAGLHVILELFDKPAFTDEDRVFAAVAADFGGELLRQALAERQTHRMLFDAVETALTASEGVRDVLQETLPPAAMMDVLKRGLISSGSTPADAETGLELVEAARALAVNHGPEAIAHCVTMARSLKALLDGFSG